MVILNLKLNNVLAFKNFEVNFSYPRKLNKSLVEGEFLKSVPSFRYKKLNIIYGSNASGKTSLVKVIWKIALFLDRKDKSFLEELVNNGSSDTSEIEIDFANENNNIATLYRTKILIKNDKSNNQKTVFVSYYGKKLSDGDSYETCVEDLNAHNYDFDDLVPALVDFPTNYGWNVVLPGTEPLFDTVTLNATSNQEEEKDYFAIINNMMKTLDPAILEVSKSQDAKDAVVVKYKGREPILIQNGNKISSIPFLSSGTKYGIQISNVIFAIKNHQNGLYLVDEQFSYVTSDIESAVLATMTSLLSSGEQLFFTTHNSNILDLGFPFHSFYFMKKSMFCGEAVITISCASDLENRNNVSPKNLYDNDAFAISPNLDFIYKLGDKEDEPM